MLEIVFFVPQKRKMENGKRKWKKKSQEGKNGFGAKRNRALSKLFFKWNCLLLF